MANNAPAVIAMKPASAANSNAIAIQTSKEWVLPPRPKPGRKADTDNAPTKRKAQNREAQRAFRERRAARVGELEQQIRDIEAAHRAELEALEVDNGQLKLDNLKLREAFEGLSRELNTIRSLTKLSESPIHSMQTPNLTPNASVPSIQIQQMASPAPSNDIEFTSTHRNSTAAISPLRFETLSEAYLGQSVPLRRRGRTSGQETPACKKRKASPRSEEVEYSFSSSAFRPPAGESCGFCSDGTPCLCAEAAQQHAEEEQRIKQGVEETEICGICAKEVPCPCSDMIETEAAGIQALPGQAIFENLDAASTMPEEDNGLCTGNPGSCRQCQLDPMSTLFCRTLASSMTELAPSSLVAAPPQRPALVQQSSAFSTSSARDETPPPAPVSGVDKHTQQLQQQFVPCSTAYQTLSRHENFKDSDLDSIVRGLDVDRTLGRGVEIGSVRDVLRILDRGLGRDV